MLKQTLDYADWDLHRANLLAFFERELGPYCSAELLVEEVIAKAFQVCDDGHSHRPGINSQNAAEWSIEDSLVGEWLERIAWDLARTELRERRQRYAVLEQLGQSLSELGWSGPLDQLVARPAGELGLVVNQVLRNLQMADCGPKVCGNHKNFIRFINRCHTLSEHAKHCLKLARRQLDRREYAPGDRHFLIEKLNEFTLELQKPEPCTELLRTYLKLMGEVDDTLASQLETQLPIE